MRIEGLHEKELFTKKLPFRRIVNEDIDFDYPSHWHNAVELLYVMQNAFIAHVNSQTYSMKEGDILFIPSGELHGFKGVTKTGRRIFINFELSSLGFFDDLNRILCHICEVRYITPGGELYEPIVSQIQKIIQADDNVNQLFYVARMIDILLLLGESRQNPIRSNSPISERKLVGMDRINKSFEYISENYQKNITLKDVAQAVGFSECYFSRLFKDITEKSFHQYLNEFRIQRAKIMLMDANCTVSQAAYAAGSSSVTTFERFFRKTNGYSPQKFRNFKI